MLNLIGQRPFLKGFEALSNLVGLHFSLYDKNQRLVLSSEKEDPLQSFIKSREKLSGLYRDFIDKNLRLALVRREPFFVKSLTGQYHSFIPLHSEDSTMITVGEAFYATDADFRHFYGSANGKALGVTSRNEEEWLKDLRIMPLDRMTSAVSNVGAVLQNMLAAGKDNDRLSRYSQQAKTIISILADLNSDYSTRNIYQIVVDAVIFLFNIDTASILLRKDGRYFPEVLEGRNKHVIQDLVISENSRLLSQSNVTEMPVSLSDSHELLHAGFPEEVASLYLFPFSSNEHLAGLLIILNSLLDKVTIDSINDLCKLTSYLCGVRQMKEEYDGKFSGLNQVSVKTSSLYSLYQDSAGLYDGIVTEASELANAEKCSLMMSRDNDVLDVRAAKGVNRWLMENVKVRRGEGIAGRVFESGATIMVSSAAEIKEYGNSPRSHYKTSSSLSMPLKVGDEMIGVLNLSDKRTGAPFTQSDIAVLTPFVQQASTLLKLGSYHETLEEMTKLSITDSLTGLFNRRYLDIRLEEEFLRAKRYNLILSMAILDIDDFKLFNDSEGHMAGDHILREIAHVMSGTVRSHDILARFGGEEFAIIMPQTLKNEAWQVSERIREAIKRHIHPTWKRYEKKHVTLCSGIATYPECGVTKEEIIRCADRALYRAKNQGKDRTVLWS